MNPQWKKRIFATALVTLSVLTMLGSIQSGSIFASQVHAFNAVHIAPLGNSPSNGYLWVNPYHKALFRNSVWVGGTIYANATSHDPTITSDSPTDGTVTDSRVCDGIGDLADATGDLLVGDDGGSSTYNACRRSALKFPISTLSGATLATATMSVYVSQSCHDATAVGSCGTTSPLVNPGLGDLSVIHIGDYGSLTASVYQASSIGNGPGVLLSSTVTPNVGFVSINVLAAMQQDINAAALYTGYRLQLATGTDGDRLYDRWFFSSGGSTNAPKIDYTFAQATTSSTTSTQTTTSTQPTTLTTTTTSGTTSTETRVSPTTTTETSILVQMTTSIASSTTTSTETTSLPVTLTQQLTETTTQTTTSGTTVTETSSETTTSPTTVTQTVVSPTTSTETTASTITSSTTQTQTTAVTTTRVRTTTSTITVTVTVRVGSREDAPRARRALENSLGLIAASTVLVATLGSRGRRKGVSRRLGVPGSDSEIA